MTCECAVKSYPTHKIINIWIELSQILNHSKRGGDGPLHVSQGSIENPLYQAFIDAGVQAGYPASDDLNGYQQEGFGRLDMTINPEKGTRWSTASAFLRPAMKRAGIQIYYES